MMLKRLALILVLGLAATIATAQQEPPRTQYESFDLSSPDAAVTTFVETFQARDYAGLFLILHPQAQQNWTRYPAATFDYSGWFNTDEATQQELATQVFDAFADETAEHDINLVHLRFDVAMLLAEDHDALPIDLRGSVRLVETEQNMPEGAAQIAAEVEGLEGRVVFSLMQVPSGRWRVIQVLAPGGDETMIPWGVARP